MQSYKNVNHLKRPITRNSNDIKNLLTNTNTHKIHYQRKKMKMEEFGCDNTRRNTMS